jgi:hypothetical protein
MDPIFESKSSVPNHQIDAWLAAVDKLHKAVAELQAAKEKAKRKLGTKISVPSKRKEENMPQDKNKENKGKDKEKPDTDDSEIEKSSKPSKTKKKPVEKIEKAEKKPSTRGRKPKVNKEEEV